MRKLSLQEATSKVEWPLRELVGCGNSHGSRLLMPPLRQIDGARGRRREEPVRHAAFERAEPGPIPGRSNARFGRRTLVY